MGNKFLLALLTLSAFFFTLHAAVAKPDLSPSFRSRALLQKLEPETTAADPPSAAIESGKHHSSDKSVAGGGVIIGGLVTAIFAAVYCYIRVTRRKQKSAEKYSIVEVPFAWSSPLHNTSRDKSQESKRPLFCSFAHCFTEGSLGSKEKWLINLRDEWFSWPPENRSAELLFQMHLLSRESSHGDSSMRWILRAIHMNPSCSNGPAAVSFSLSVKFMLRWRWNGGCICTLYSCCESTV
ncbi:hypothetical protein SASPL_124387 [Salvia splendens]|uniref:Uncharacterized protein n=1 Tax=Salvia splendens TaxID=180675 RepID=A0A8X8XMS2_SALSN|nr:hypothetical protein SASPL_124387 [Salvia splendens]